MKSYKEILNEKINTDALLKDINAVIKDLKDDKFNKALGGMQFTGSVDAYIYNNVELHVNFPTRYGKVVTPKIEKILKKYNLKYQLTSGTSNVVFNAKI